MKKFLKWLGIGVGALAALVVIAWVVVYVLAERAFDQRFTAATQREVPLLTDDASIEAGKHLAIIHGCISCHGKDLTGGEIFDIPHIARYIGPNITGAAQKYSPTALATLIQQGIRANGKSLWVMPSATFHHLTDDDLAKIIAFVRSVPAHDGTHEESDIRMGLRAAIAFGKFKSAAAEVLDLPPEPTPAALSAPALRGRYLVMSTCTECHGQDLNGMELAGSPPLAVVMGYEFPDFQRLMHEGIALGDRKLDLMREMSLARYVHFTDAELAEVYSFLHAPGEKAAAP